MSSTSRNLVTGSHGSTQHPARLVPLREFAERLVESGAFMILSGTPSRPQRVTRVTWRGPNTLSWVAGRGRRGDAHQLTFDDLRAVAKHGVCFVRGDHIVAYLSKALSSPPSSRTVSSTQEFPSDEILAHRRP